MIDRRPAARERACVAGISLLELLASLALATVLGAGLARGAAELGDALGLEAQRASLLGLFGRARQRSYRLGRTIAVERHDDGGLAVVDGNLVVARHRLARGFAMDRWPRRHSIRFYAGGLADNATVGLRSPDGRSAKVIINQRGRLR